MNLPSSFVTDAQISRAVTHLAEAVRFPTVTYTDINHVDLSFFTAFQDWVLDRYPLAAQHLEPREGPWNLQFHWRGTDPDANPLILLAHYDVVPPGDPALWAHDPFCGEVIDGELWGRGTLDVKINLVSILEAVENALAEGFAPRRDLWLCFGGDEEIGGTRGAGELGKKLATRGVKNAWLVDEGGVIARGSLSFVSRPVALVGVAEKGFVNLRVSVEGAAGHASMPPGHTAAGLLAQALVRIEARPFPWRLTRTMAAFLQGASRHASPVLGFFLRAPRFWWPLLRLILGANPKTAAMIRTTQAITMLQASSKENVLPARASAIINVRILPGDTVATVIEHYNRLLRGTGCTVEVADERQRNEPLPESELGGAGWEAVLAALRIAEPEAVPLPYLVTAGTDTRHYVSVADNMYRIMALVLEPSEIDLIHSPNERISVANIGRSLRFYDALIRS